MTALTTQILYGEVITKFMNVLFITHYSSLYGANRSLLALLDGLDSNELSPFVLLPGSGDIEDELQKRGISYAILPFKKWMAESRLKAVFRLFMNLTMLPFILAKMYSWQIGMLYTNSSLTPVGAWSASFAGLPHIWHIREFGWEDYNLKHDFGRGFFEYWLNKADHIITVSKSIKHKVLKNVSTPSTVIYNGVISKNESEQINIPSADFSKKKTVFGIIGLLGPAKGQDQAIKAFARVQKDYPETELLLAGRGSDNYEHYLQELVSELDLSGKVQFLGYVDDPFGYYSKIDVVLVCSPNEGMGRVTAEAMVAGKVVIGLDNAGTGELIDDNNTGLLYDGTTESLASKMLFALQNNTEELSQKAREVGINHFLIENYSGKVREIIYSVFTQ